MEIPEFDPLGLSKGKDEATIGYYRAAELKHGRVCMLASVGYLVQGLYHLPDGPFEASKPLDALIKVSTERPLAAVQVCSGVCLSICVIVCVIFIIAPEKIKINIFMGFRHSSHHILTFPHTHPPIPTDRHCHRGPRGARRVHPEVH